MAKSERPRARRGLAALAGALLLALLLELNQWLPGVWPGAGGPLPAPGDPAAVTRAQGIAPGERRPPPPREPAFQVVVAAPEGFPDATGAVRLETADGPREAPLEGGRARFEERPRGLSAVTVTREGRTVRHGPPGARGVREVRVAWPKATPPPEPALAEPTLEVVVEGHAGRVEGARVAWTAGGSEGLAATGAQGLARIERLPAPVVRLTASAPGHGEAVLWVSALAGGGRATVRLPREIEARTTFVDPDTDAPLRVARVRLVGPGLAGSWLDRQDDPDDGVCVRLPETLVRDGAIEVETEGRPLARIPLRDLKARSPVGRGRALEVVARDPRGAPAAGATVTVRYAPGPDPEAAGEERLEARTAADASGRARVPVPADRAVEVVVEAEGAAPAAVSVAPADETARAEVTLAEGVALAVRVRDEDGRPLLGARVVALAASGGTTLRRTATSDAGGLAILPPVPEGDVEVYAGAPGRAWASAVVRARPGLPETALALARGLRLRLIVEDPHGVPLEGVLVQAVPRPGLEGQSPDASDPDAAPWRTDAQGVLEVANLPDREVDLLLHLEGHEDEIVSRVRPGASAWFATLVPKGAPGR